MDLNKFITLGDIAIVIVCTAMLMSVILAWRDRKQYHSRLTFLELWKVDHDTWASSRSESLNQQILANQRLATLIEVMDKRLSRIEEHHWASDEVK